MNYQTLQLIIICVKMTYKYCNTIISSLCASQPSQSICPLHNTERLLYWAMLANIKLDKFNSTISIRRFPTEEWENPEYRSSRMISPKFYIDNFDTTKGCYNTLLTNTLLTNTPVLGNTLLTNTPVLGNTLLANTLVLANTTIPAYYNEYNTQRNHYINIW